MTIEQRALQLPAIFAYTLRAFSTFAAELPAHAIHVGELLPVRRDRRLDATRGALVSPAREIVAVDVEAPSFTTAHQEDAPAAAMPRACNRAVARVVGDFDTLVR
jgi:hypothetical protein